MSTAKTKTRRLSTADERRETVLAAGMKVFADRGYHGTPTAEVAREAGISHAYLFRLFPTKADLVLALVERSNRRIYDTFSAAAAEAKAAGDDVLAVMGSAYIELLGDRELLMSQLHGHAAATEPKVREAARAGFRRLFELVEAESGATPADVKRFMAEGMLLNVLAAMDAPAVDERWARILTTAHPEDDA